MNFILPSFNSILVRLKAKSVENVIMVLPRFQFHTGSIKSPAIYLFQRPQCLFQFHTGSIKSHPHHERQRPKDQFQFHTGSIKS